MWYVEVLVADATYHQEGPLTYSSSDELRVGQVVTVPVRKKQVLGIVAAVVGKPTFKAKEIIATPSLPPLPGALLDLLQWMRAYYPAPLGLTTQLFLPGNLPKKAIEPLRPDTVAAQALPKLTDDQQGALEALTHPGLHILHGETGSGKTRVYIELAKRSLAAGKSALILTPEIGLTSQLAQGFRSVFGKRVTIVHSGLTDTARSQTWQQLLEQTDPVIVIGARSALFSPLSNLGLIVVDEAHEPSYKQDQAPYYHASTVAAKLAALHGSVLILGSATPLVSDYYIASAKSRPIIRMTQLAASQTSDKADLQVIDLRDRGQFSKSPHLSSSLVDAMRTTLQSQGQVLLFLNRRGTARVIFCEVCGWRASCPECDLPLIYHGDHHVVRCHTCSYKASVPASCPDCLSTDVIFKSIGTKAITAEAERLFPEAKVMRFDTDNRKSERLEANYDAIRSGQIDIIVGTQTLAKGLDLPRLSLVGVVAADTSLYFPDFSAEERTYQLLSQVLGRIGRGHRQGAAIIQTYTPDSPLLQSILNKDWGTFYNTELQERRQFLFPPFCYLLKIQCKRATSASAQKAAESLAATLKARRHGVIIEGPAPSFYEKQQNKFVWQLVIKAKDRKRLTAIIAQLPSGWSYDIDPINLL
jgi:primosomal protein N' (replication factor Y) (superfamily II helicase)